MVRISPTEVKIYPTALASNYANAPVEWIGPGGSPPQAGEMVLSDWSAGAYRNSYGIRSSNPESQRSLGLELHLIRETFPAVVLPIMSQDLLNPGAILCKLTTWIL